MYIVKIKNGNLVQTIHGHKEKLASGKITKGINTIDSFVFSMLPDNPGFPVIHEFTTIVEVYNTNKSRYDFIGRVLYAETTMDEAGHIKKSVTCESIMGYLCDSIQTYVDTQNWTVSGLLQHLIDCHNSQVEEYKHFHLGTVTASDANDNLYQAVQRENTWEAINSKLIQKIGGELQIRVVDGVNYLDYLEQIGEVKDTPIELSVNMKSITREQDPTAFITRLIPLGCKLTDEEGNETEQRLDITSVNDGKNYVEDSEAVAVYGIHVGIVEFDDVTEPQNLLNKGEAWLDENNKVQIKYSITALDLSLIGQALDDFDVGNTHPVKNGLIGVDDSARVIKNNIDVCEETKSTIEVGDNFKSLSDIQREQTAQLNAAAKNLNNLQQHTANLTGDFAKQLQNLNTKVDTTAEALQEDYDTKIYDTAGRLQEDYTSKIEQFSNSISLEVNGSLGSKASIKLSAGGNEYSGEFSLEQIRQAFADDATAISISAGLLTFNAGTLVINSGKFTLDSSGKITATDAVIYGDIITIDGVYKTEMDKGSLRLYYSDTLCGTINTKYWSGASTEGISLRIEEGGNYIMFSHADDTQGSGYVVDYYLNKGWSSNYDEMHIFQTSARFLSDVYLDGKTDIGSLVLRGPGGKRYLVTAYDGVLECSEI